VNIAANEIRFSQKSVSFSKVDRATGQAFTYDDLVMSMRTNGWKGDPVDVVRMPDTRLTSIDNTRISAAREAGIDVKANLLLPALAALSAWRIKRTVNMRVPGQLSLVI